MLIEDPQRKSILQRQADQIQQFIQEGGPIEVTGRIRGHYRYKYRLIGNSFSVSSINGRLAEAQIYCDRGMKGFALEEDMSYEIPEELGECNLIIIGDRNDFHYLSGFLACDTRSPAVENIVSTPAKTFPHSFTVESSEVETCSSAAQPASWIIR